MIWLYLAWLVLLLGTNIAFYMQHPEYLPVVRSRQPSAFAIGSGWRCTRCTSSASATTADARQSRPKKLAAELRIPTNVGGAMLDALIDAGLVAPTEEKPVRFLPARPWEGATWPRRWTRFAAHGVVPAVYTGRPVRRVAVDNALTAFERAAGDALEGTTLKAFATMRRTCHCAYDRSSEQRESRQ
jgi:membrane protein